MSASGVYRTPSEPALENRREIHESPPPPSPSLSLYLHPLMPAKIIKTNLRRFAPSSKTLDSPSFLFLLFVLIFLRLQNRGREMTLNERTRRGTRRLLWFFPFVFGFSLVVFFTPPFDFLRYTGGLWQKDIQWDVTRDLCTACEGWMHPGKSYQRVKSSNCWVISRKNWDPPEFCIPPTKLRCCVSLRIFISRLEILPPH